MHRALQHRRVSRAKRQRGDEERQNQERYVGRRNAQRDLPFEREGDDCDRGNPLLAMAESSGRLMLFCSRLTSADFVAQDLRAGAR